MRIFNIKILAIMSVFVLLSLPVFSLELDTSVDEEIKSKYNSNKLNEEMLPALPQHLKNSPSANNIKTNSVAPKTAPEFIYEQPNIIKISSEHQNLKKIPKGTKFKVKSTTKINDWMSKNTNVYFTSIEAVNKKNVYIPSGTTFTGIITDVHRPHLTGNGGLVKIDIKSMKYNGNYFEADGKITKANNKRIFINNIKGERQYIAGVKKQITKGENFYKKTQNISSKMSKNPIGQILAPIPSVVGFLGASAATVISPVTGLTQKGKDISIPSGSNFEIKIRKTLYIY